jgi:hypothetical protein
MIFLNLAETDIALATLEKIGFFVEHSYFKSDDVFVSSKGLKNSATNIVKYIISHKEKIIKNVNFMFIDDTKRSWTFIVIAERKTPMIIINERSIAEHFRENIRRYQSKGEVRFRAVIFAISIYLLGVSVIIDCFQKPILEKAQNIWDFGNEIANKIFEYEKNVQKYFSIYQRVSEPNLSKLFSFDKKYVFSVMSAFKDGKINKNTACVLLDIFDENEFDELYMTYEKTCEIELINFRLRDEIDGKHRNS